MKIEFKTRKQCEDLEHSLVPFVRNNVIKEIKCSYKGGSMMEIVFRDLTDDENIDAVKNVIRDAKVY